MRQPSGGHISRQTGIVFTDTHLVFERNPYAKNGRNSSAGYGGNMISRNMIWEKSKMANGDHICQWTASKFGRAQLDHQENRRFEKLCSRRKCDNEKFFMDGRMGERTPESPRLG